MRSYDDNDRIKININVLSSQRKFKEDFDMEDLGNNKQERKTTSSTNKIELLIDKKISEAKLYVAEKRINFLLTIGTAILTIFGIILPMFLTFQSARKVDEAIQNMEQKFNESAGKQMRKPRIECYLDGKDLVSGFLFFDPKKTERVIEIKNVGDGTADFIKMRFYVNYEDEDFIRDLRNTGWEHRGINDKPEFKLMFDYADKSGVVPAGLRKQDVKAAALLKIFYGEPVPKEIPFSFEIRTK